MRLSHQLTMLCLLLLGGVAPLATFAQDGPSPIDLTPPTLGEFDPASVEEIRVEDLPIVPDITDHARQIYAAGQAEGRAEAVFTKVGDCMTASKYFFTAFATAEGFDLGEYDDLTSIIETFQAIPVLEEYNSFSNPSQAMASGFNTASVLDPIWANPEFCGAEESPLTCEYRLSNASFSIIMFGTNDVFFLDAATFDYYLRTIILQTITSNIVPIMSTIPTRPEFPEQTYLYNQIIIKIAQDYDLPIVNLWAAIQDLPNEGVDPIEPIHLSIPEDANTGDFVNNLEYGYTVRNLLMLQTLETLWQGVRG
jgi:hypothetical protein